MRAPVQSGYAQRMRNRLSSVLIAGVTLGCLALVSRSALGEPAGALVAAYGTLMVLLAVFLVAELAARRRARRPVIASTSDESPGPNHIAGLRVF